MSERNQPKIVVVTGGVVSSLGKGIVASSLGNLLAASGLKVSLQKADPYLNLDPGTQSPYEHGEVFVTADGAETDLDLGHYERFTDTQTSRRSSFSQGQVYETVLRAEREGKYLGKTVQIIPHVTDEIERRILEAAQNSDVHIVEIGGTVGDVESQPFMWALRSMRRRMGQRMCFVHCTYVPHIPAAGEIKTKPTQHSVADLRELGITPDVIVLRSSVEVPSEARRKIAMMCDVADDAVIASQDARSIYEVPLLLQAEGLDRLVLRKFMLRRATDEPTAFKPADLSAWRKMCSALIGSSVPVRVGLVGKYLDHQDAYLSIVEAVRHAAAAQQLRAEVVGIDAEQLTDTNVEAVLGGLDAVIIPGGFGDRGVDGKIAAAAFCRRSGKPMLGICLGMQVMVIEAARHMAQIKAAHSREFVSKGKACVIDLSAEQKGVTDRGGTMRLGAQDMIIAPNTRLRELYGSERVTERHRHRFEVAEKFVPALEKAGLIISARHPDRGLVEAVEVEGHAFYVGVQAHPEFTSRPTRPHPLFEGLVASALGR